MSSRARLTSLVVLLLALAALPATALAGPVTLTTAASGSNTVVTATAPVVNSSTTTATLTQTFDSAVSRLTGTTDVVAPVGWTTTYSTDGATFGAAPVTAAGWAAIKAVKSTGPMVSTGASGANQTISRSQTFYDAPGGSINATNSSGDSWTVFTSPTRVYTMWHHNGRDNSTQGAFDCFLRDGTHCAGFPFMLTPLETGTRVEGWYDETNDHIWGVVSRPNGTGAGPGFVCVDVSGASPAYCGGSLATGFIPTGTVAPSSGTSSYGCGATRGAALNCANDFAQVGGKLYAWEAVTGKLMCVDTQASSGAGAPCTGQPYAFTGVGAAITIVNSGSVTERRSGLAAIGGKIYGSAMATQSATTGSVGICFDPATRTTCSGWPKTMTGLLPYIYEQVDTSGTSQGICFRELSTGTSTATCYDPAGTTITTTTGLSDALIIAGRGYGWVIAKNPVRIGTKYIWGNTSWEVGNANGSAGRLLNCYDVATSTTCPGWPKTGVLNYSMAADAYNANCVWKATDDGAIQSYAVDTGVAGCPQPATVSVQASGLISDLSCGRTGPSAWQSIAISGTTYTSATLTVKNNGSAVTGWSGIPFASGSVNLASLSVADSGANPTFEITFTGRNSTSPTVSVVSASSPPQLCATLHPVAGCPATAGQYHSLPSSTDTVTGEGTAATGSGTETFTNGTAGVTYTPTAAQCLGTIQGTTTIDGTTTPIPGIVVTLDDGAGNVIATATTDAQGFYSFPNLAPVTGYKVTFGSTSGMSPNSSTSSAPNTPRTVTVGGTTVVNGQYAAQTNPSNPNPNPLPSPIAQPDFATTPKGTPVTLPLFGNDAASTGGTLVPSSVRLQDPATGKWATTVTIPGEGTYVVDPATGNVTFTPVPSFIGKTKPLPYRVTDSTGKTAPSYIQITVVTTPPPYANPDYVAGKQGQTLILPALVNDSTTSGAFDPATVLIQDPKTKKWGTRVVIPQEGTYIVDPSTGRVSFVPLPSFVGTATPVNYQVKTTGGKTVKSSLHPRLIGPMPRLRITTTATVPDLVPGQRTVIKLHACNVGKATALNTTVDLPVPSGFAIVQLRGAAVRAGTATWNTGTMKKGACVDRTILLVAVKPGQAKALGTVRASNAGPDDDPTPLVVHAGVYVPSGVTG